ncbi:hypothetical protein B0H21DRAFT_579566 [Amylocystis lapponica]|nr:hypothetical protein B0H21DRAFT_579566 [Amylocystis lapponica]
MHSISDRSTSVILDVPSPCLRTENHIATVTPKLIARYSVRTQCYSSVPATHEPPHSQMGEPFAVDTADPGGVGVAPNSDTAGGVYPGPSSSSDHLPNGTPHSGARSSISPGVSAVIAIVIFSLMALSAWYCRRRLQQSSSWVGVRRWVASPTKPQLFDVELARPCAVDAKWENIMPISVTFAPKPPAALLPHSATPCAHGVHRARPVMSWSPLPQKGHRTAKASQVQIAMAIAMPVPRDCKHDARPPLCLGLADVRWPPQS